MTNKAECESVIRHLSHEWAAQAGVNVGVDHASFSAFESWLSGKGYSHYLSFRSVRGSREDAEQWFDEEMKQTWRR
ncbi:hypothetical protein [Methylocystis echinoides]|nr:hypothetical protein [Methylocystis echinoides]